MGKLSRAGTRYAAGCLRLAVGMIAATAGAIAGGYGGYLISLEAEMERDTELAIAWGLVAVGFLTGPWLVGRVWKPHD